MYFTKCNQDGKPGHIKPHRIETLEKGGFLSGMSTICFGRNKLQETDQVQDHQRNLRYSLQVSKGVQEDPELGRNSNASSTVFFRAKAKRPHSLKIEIKKLEDIGFDWKMDEDGDPGSRKKRRNIIDPSKDELEEWWEY